MTDPHRKNLEAKARLSAVGLLLLLSGVAGVSPALAAPLVPPPEPAVRPAIAEAYSCDADGDKVEDALLQRMTKARSDFGKAVSAADKAAAQARLDAMTDVEVVFKKQITQKQIDTYLAAGGAISHIYQSVSYGWNGQIPLSQVGGLPALLGANVAVVVQPVAAELHMDTATQTGRVRPIWASGFAGDTNGFSGNTNIAIAIVDTGVDETHTDLNGRRAYWKDTSTDAYASPSDLGQHGSHVAGIALGSGASAGSSAGTLYFTQNGTLSGVPNGSFYPNPIELPASTLTFTATARWNGGGSTTLYLLYHTRGTSGGWTAFATSGSGSSPLTVSSTFTPSTSRVYSSALLSNGSNTTFVVTNQVSNYPASADGFNKLRGVAPSCRWVGVKVFSDAGTGNTTTIGAGIDEAVTYRTNYNIKVMNLSLGSIGDPGIDTTERQKIITAVSNGIVAVVSAGNDGRNNTVASRTVDDPGRAALVLTVAAANDVNQLTDYTSVGFTNPVSTSGLEEDYKPDIMAPGGSLSYYTPVLSADSNTGDGSAYGDQKTNDYYNIQGTSMSSPFAAGCAALVIDALQRKGTNWNFTSSLHPRLVKMLLCATASESNTTREDGGTNRTDGVVVNPSLQRASSGPDGYPAAKDRYEGYGMINPDAAVEAVSMVYTQGTSATITLGAGATERRAWARTVSLSGGVAFKPQLTCPAGGDYDMYLYSFTPSAYGTPVILASSTSSGNGSAESNSYTAAVNTNVLLVVKRVAGSGDATLLTYSASNTLTVASQYGMAAPAVGTYTYTPPTNLTCSITNSPLVLTTTQSVVTCVCTGWTGTGSVPASGTGTNTSFTLTADSTITWGWVITDMVVSNQAVGTATNLQARDTVTARDGYVVGPTGNVDMQAGQTIRLQSGFTVRTGATFRARTVP